MKVQRLLAGFCKLLQLSRHHASSTNSSRPKSTKHSRILATWLWTVCQLTARLDYQKFALRRRGCSLANGTFRGPCRLRRLLSNRCDQCSAVFWHHEEDRCTYPTKLRNGPWHARTDRFPRGASYLDRHCESQMVFIPKGFPILAGD